MRHKLPTPIPVRKALSKLGGDLREARIRRRISAQQMADRVDVSRVTLKAMEDGSPSVSMGTYATALYMLGLLDRVSELADIAHDPVGRTLSRYALPKRVYKRKE